MKNIASLAFSLLFSFSLSLQGQQAPIQDAYVFGELRVFRSGERPLLTWSMTQQREWAYFAIERFEPGSASPEWLGGLALHSPVAPGLPFSFCDELGSPSASASYRVKAVTRSQEVFYSQTVRLISMPFKLSTGQGPQPGQLSLRAEGQPMLSFRIYNANGQEELSARLAGQAETFIEWGRLPAGKHVIVVETPSGPVSATIHKP